MDVTAYQCHDAIAEYSSKFRGTGLRVMETFIVFFCLPEHLGDVVVLTDFGPANLRKYRRLGFTDSPILLQGEQVVRARKPLALTSYYKGDMNAVFIPKQAVEFERKLRGTRMFLRPPECELESIDITEADFDEMRRHSGGMAALANLVEPGARLFTFACEGTVLFAFAMWGT